MDLFILTTSSLIRMIVAVKNTITPVIVPNTLVSTCTLKLSRTTVVDYSKIEKGHKNFKQVVISYTTE